MCACVCVCGVVWCGVVCCVVLWCVVVCCVVHVCACVPLCSQSSLYRHDFALDKHFNYNHYYSKHAEQWTVLINEPNQCFQYFFHLTLACLFQVSTMGWAFISLSRLKFSNRHVDRSCSKLAAVQQHDCEVSVARVQPVITTEPPLSHDCEVSVARVQPVITTEPPLSHDCEVSVARVQPVITTEPPLSHDCEVSIARVQPVITTEPPLSHDCEVSVTRVQPVITTEPPLS